MVIWNQTLDDSLLDQSSREWLTRWQETEVPPVEMIWRTMDEVWDALGLANHTPLNHQVLAQYYSHPVWTLNGVFTEVDPVSLSHRKALARHIAKLGFTRGADYGGGSGVLAQEIASACPSCTIDIIEPFPSALTKTRISACPAISITPGLSADYDFVIAQDVLEHVADPILLARDIIRSVRPGGMAIFANCFYPVIKCHLPHTFHLRHTFPWVIAPLGVSYEGRIPGARHIQCFQRISDAPESFDRTHSREAASRTVGQWLNAVEKILSIARRVLKRSIDGKDGQS